MFESAEIGHSVPKDEFLKREAVLREALLKAQYDLLADKSFPVVIVIGGVDGAGKGETVNILNAWMDPRHIVTSAFGEPSDEESERPRMWRYWRALPPRGHVGILFGAWHTDPILDRVMNRTGDGKFNQEMNRISRFEEMLADEGALILKFWFHLSKSAQKERLADLQKRRRTRWRVVDEDLKRLKLYDTFRAVCEDALRVTSSAWAPWIVVEGSDAHYRYLTVGQTLLDALNKRLEEGKRPVPRSAALPEPAIDNRNILRSLDFSPALSHKKYSTELEKWQGRLNLLCRSKKFRRRSSIIVFEGNDAAGKGSTIRRITGALDARFYRVAPIAAPTEEERAQPYLWRFWRHLGRQGRTTIFDRSWYGRVLVERVEGMCAKDDWMRAYREINDFESELVDAGVIVTKFWLAIDKDEQLARFRQREATPFKRFKITPEDWRNRDRWEDYERAVCDMVERTSIAGAPWAILPANDKYWTRIEALKTLCHRIEAAL